MIIVMNKRINIKHKISFLIILNILFFNYAFAGMIDINTHWANKEISILLNEKIVQGYDDGTFKPDKAITVSEFIKIMVEMAEYELEIEGNPWPDWYINTAIKNNLISEKEFDNYSRNITRYEAAKIISNYINLKDIQKNKNIFSDLKNNEKDIVLKLVKLGVINGYSDGTFKSDNEVTRAEACKLIINAYNAKQKLICNRKYEFSEKLINIKTNSNTNKINTFDVKNNRIYIYDSGKYAYLNGQTLNQEYIKDRKVIKMLSTLIDEESYTELKFVPDKYIINSLNICYGNNELEVQNGNYIFEIRFYENAFYDVSLSKDNPEFMNEACIKIKTGKMWNKKFESETDISCSHKNISKLKNIIGIILDEEVKEEFIDYFIEKRIEASNFENTGYPKISEVKTIGKYVINTFCITDKDLEFYIQKIN